MNERIKQLALEANLRPAVLLNHYDNINALTYSEQEVLEQLEKFAQLIVQDCLQISDEFEIDVNQSGLVSRIAQHFGVEDRAVPILSADEQALFAGIASSKLFTIAGAKKQFGVEE